MASMRLLDVENSFLGDLYLTWDEVHRLRDWCADHGLPDPFIGG